MGAQRLSASKRIAQAERDFPTGLVNVLNAFRHQRGSHLTQFGERRLKVRVLNAFRHQRGSHNLSVSNTGQFIHVLNAFRHQRGSHAQTSQLTSASRCAQRLSASKRIAPIRRWGFERMAVCSTPFGIKEDRTLRRWSTATARPCAQRLSASKRIALGATVQKGQENVECSTPFGIKEDRTRQRAAVEAIALVLNAFRHQRGSHFPLRDVDLDGLGVLNAFRHQRGSHKPFSPHAPP